MSSPTRRAARRGLTALALTLSCALAAPAATAQADQDDAQAAFDVLVFSRTAGFRHDSIPAGIDALRALGTQGDFTVTATENPAAFTPANLASYEAVVFLNTTGNVLDDTQQSALESYVDGGGGFVGVHAAADTEYDWPYYGRLVGAYFKSHPAVQQATVRTEDRTHPATAHLGATWTRTDEWYNYRTNPRPGVRVLQTLDESTYGGGEMGADHPITWCHTQGKGRAFYTGLGHTAESYGDPAFRTLLLGAVRYAAGQAPADCSAPSGPAQVEAESFSSGSGVQIAAHAPASGGRTLGYIDNGDWAAYSSVSTAGARSFTARVSSAGAGGTVEIRSGSATGTLLGSVRVPVTGGWETFTTVSTALTGTASGPLVLRFTGGSGALFDIDTFTLSTQPTTTLNPSVHLFHYPWYGSPAVNGGWRHWQQGGHTPPDAVGADFYPALSPCDSGDFTGAVAQHMKWAARSGAGVVVTSWWGRGSYEDRLARGILDAAQKEGVSPDTWSTDGAAYDRQWTNALDPAIGGSPTWVSVTSFNEWHEGSSIEPADSTPPAGHGYRTYDGAYGRTGPAAETAYLDRTAHWAARFPAPARR
ncbi:ThuA domain-containing protein [Streptomyces sp.]|uniref:ThuA domain-containing protein n=1 Tax=Streptomyces sp. TaxID=1931 RepID=UPI002D29E8D2|nr:ThuA domain-containing protein [Streptomyces sp.]HZF91596.1 ThuA domain-containing protein [Streptomyces sp.]